MNSFSENAQHELCNVFWVRWVMKYMSCEETPKVLCADSAHHDIYCILFSAPGSSFHHDDRSNQSSFVLHNMTKLSQLFMRNREKQQLHFFIRLFMFNLLMLNCFFLKRSENFSLLQDVLFYHRKREHRQWTVSLTGSIPSLLHSLGLSYISGQIPKT